MNKKFGNSVKLSSKNRLRLINLANKIKTSSIDDYYEHEDYGDFEPYYVADVKVLAKLADGTEKEIRPSYSRSPRTALRSVLFPAPLGPMRATI